MKSRCCRSTPRCATCPVRAAAVARTPAEGHEPAAVLAEMLRGSRARTLPQSVTAALADLERARTLG
jgi:hypothetical protein